MIAELRDRPAKYLKPGIDNSLVSPAMTGFMVERAQLLVEMEVLNAFFQARMQRMTPDTTR